jgi:hypothetical protein
MKGSCVVVLHLSFVLRTFVSNSSDPIAPSLTPGALRSFLSLWIRLVRVQKLEMLKFRSKCKCFRRRTVIIDAFSVRNRYVSSLRISCGRILGVKEPPNDVCVHAWNV